MIGTSMDPFDSVYEDDCDAWPFFSLDYITRERCALELAYLEFITKDTSNPYIFDQGQVENVGYSAVLPYIKRTKHEIKAIEYYLRDMLKKRGYDDKGMLHYGLTSQDIVDPVYTIAIKNYCCHSLSVSVNQIINVLLDNKRLSGRFVARTHGQLAGITTLDKILLNYAQRVKALDSELRIRSNDLRVKFGGSLGEFKYTTHDQASKFFDEYYGIEVATHTTQVNHNDDKAAVFLTLVRINNVIIDFVQNLWLYFSYGYLFMEVDKDHVGSSTMPQKINPIAIENIEGILQYANVELHFMADKLTKSRDHRDLSDSVVQRFYGTMLVKCSKAYKDLYKFIPRIRLDNKRILAEIIENGQLHAETLQLLCKKQYGRDCYQEIKDLTQGMRISLTELEGIVEKSYPEVSDEFSKVVSKIYKDD